MADVPPPTTTAVGAVPTAETVETVPASTAPPAVPPAASEPPVTIYQFGALRKLDGTILDLNTLRGKVVLILNSASKSTLAKQMTEIERLYRTYGREGFEVLAFPCSQFLGQEYDTPAEIIRYCDSTFGTTFHLMEKVRVNGADAHPLFKFLKAQQPGIGAFIKWSFTKFLIDRNGVPVDRFGPTATADKLQPEIERLLHERGAGIGVGGR